MKEHTNKKIKAKINARHKDRRELYDHVAGFKPRCVSFRSNRPVLHLEKGKGESFQEAFVDPGCGRVHLCKKCGEHQSKLRSGIIISILKALSTLFLDMMVAHYTFTLPKNHKWQTNECARSYKDFFKAVRETLEHCFPGCGCILVLHNWSSKNPENKHIHIHVIIIGLTKKGGLVSGFVDEKALKEVYKSKIGLNANDVINVHQEYFKASTDFGRIAHVVRYALRSPIEDYCKEGEKPLSAKYIDRVKHLVGIQNTRYCGWLSNSTKAKTLESFGIVKAEDSEEEKWRLVERTEVDRIDENGNIVLKNGICILKEDLKDKSFLIKKPFYKVIKPPG